MRRRPPAAPLLALAILVAASLYHYGPLLGCIDSCFADLRSLHGGAIGRVGLADVRLNAWILAWVQHSLLSDPAGLFQANAFYPARDALAGSEHLIAPALLVLPVRLATRSPVALHQVATVLSGLLLGVTTFAFVRWASGSTWAALLAGLVSVFMPWRIAELSHVQLLNAQWIPLTWLFAGRLLLGEGRWGSAAGLSAALSLQLLSSAYLAYYASLALALFALVPVVREPGARAAAGRLLAALVLPALLLVLASLPYLERALAADAAPRPGRHWYSLGFGGAWQLLAPHLPGASSPGGAGGYSVPLAVGVLAVAAALPLLGRRPARGPRGRRRRLVTASLWAVAIGAFAMMTGREARVGGYAIPMPSEWAAHIVPGFAFLGTPLRWGLLIAIAAAALAGLGIAYLDRVVQRAAGARSRIALPAWRIAVAAVLLAGVPWRPVPAREAWPPGDSVLRAHAAIAELPFGPVLELPWSLQRVPAMELESRYMLGSALHWRPILNGFTAYRPPSYALLKRIAQDLPEPHALERLRAFVDLRWIVVHPDELPRGEREAWRPAAAAGAGLRLERSLQGVRIFEVPGWEGGGRRMEALAAPGRSETLSGLSRRALALEEGAGAVEADLPQSFAARRLRPLRRLPVRITNATRVPWPGFDPRPEGLVRLRYAFRREDGGLALEGSVALDADIPAHSTVEVEPWIEVPSEPGRYRLRLDLVQRVDGAPRRLPVAPLERSVAVRPGGAGGGRTADRSGNG